ncbi:MAG: hypothetical protein M1828_005492 [Chrysothrix sp. TS-e1954]|nr:MAG: hypothetical protein M1828_005492 [Chrysothrix sp. TS-e1954]
MSTSSISSARDTRRLKSEERGFRLERSPHPYYRRRSNGKSGSKRLAGKSLKLGPSPLHSDSGLDPCTSASRSGSPSDSGTEADDEAFGVVKALPAPPVTPSKGLKTGEAIPYPFSSSPSPPYSPVFGARFLDHRDVPGKSRTAVELRRPDADLQLRSWRKRRAELTRRTCEVLLLGILGSIAFSSHYHSPAQRRDQLRTASYVSLPLLACCLYVFRIGPRRHTPGAFKCFRLPSSFDPAPIIYPYALPALISLSLRPRDRVVLQINLVLGISALPDALLPFGNIKILSELHWMLSLLLVILSPATKLVANPQHNPKFNVSGGTIAVLLYPLHRCLIQSLQYLTTSSLLPSELQLLSIGLINMLLLSETPCAVILSLVVWIGGIGLLTFCHRPLKWNVALERIPRWRFRRAGTYVRAANSFLGTLSSGLNQKTSDSASLLDAGEHGSPKTAGQTLLTKATSSWSVPRSVASRASFSAGDGRKLASSDATGHFVNGDASEPSKPRRQTVTVAPRALLSSRMTNGHRRRVSLSTTTQQYLSMSPAQAQVRKWYYAVYTYIVILVLVFVPIRSLIGSRALNGNEPFAWAIGYLFGDVHVVRGLAADYTPAFWIPLPSVPASSASVYHSLLSLVRQSDMDNIQHYRAPATSPTLRLYLLAHFIITLTLGLLTTFSLSPSIADVDTRRKIFHFTMVILLLPSIFLDPPFLALTLSLVVSVFLLLEVVRAGQLRPLSKPLARFLSPYVDGRDLRGPVVVSHIFLAIGCAIPLWLALAGVDHDVDAEGPFAGWTAATRDVSMVAGVICVGMGDAAASLVGRRFGRHKWPWPGGKSLEGSAAFAIVVTAGLITAKAYLRAGGWVETYADADEGWVWLGAKSLAAACGASFTEAVLTGCNDNVVVPVVLWLFVRGLKL